MDPTLGMNNMPLLSSAFQHGPLQVPQHIGVAPSLSVGGVGQVYGSGIVGGLLGAGYGVGNISSVGIPNEGSIPVPTGLQTTSTPFQFTHPSMQHQSQFKPLAHIAQVIHPTQLLAPQINITPTGTPQLLTNQNIGNEKLQTKKRKNI